MVVLGLDLGGWCLAVGFWGWGFQLKGFGFVFFGVKAVYINIEE